MIIRPSIGFALLAQRNFDGERIIRAAGIVELWSYARVQRCVELPVECRLVRISRVGCAARGKPFRRGGSSVRERSPARFEQPLC